MLPSPAYPPCPTCKAQALVQDGDLFIRDMVRCQACGTEYTCKELAKLETKP